VTRSTDGKPRATPSQNLAVRGGWWIIALASWPVQYLLYVPIQCGSRLFESVPLRPNRGDVDDPLSRGRAYTPPERHDFLRAWPELRPWFIDHLRASGS